jgi:uncharacterized protein (DUF983 family)
MISQGVVRQLSRNTGQPIFSGIQTFGSYCYQGELFAELFDADEYL